MSAATQFSSPLDCPRSIAENYASNEQIIKLFGAYSTNSLLTKEEMASAFPSGILTHEFFFYKRQKWRLLARREGFGPNTPLVFVSVADGPTGRDSLAISSSAGFMSPSRMSINPNQRSNRRLQSPSQDSPRSSLSQLQLSSRPLDILGSSTQSPFSSISCSLDQYQNQDSLTSHSLMESPQKSICFPTPHNTPTLVKHCDQSRIWTDNLLAAESLQSTPLHRFKAFVRLIRSLPKPPHTVLDYLNEAQIDGARSAFMVGEALSRFGMSFGLNHDNSSRAITSADYASLLSSYLKQCGGYYADSFISHLPPHHQDESVAIKMLLEVRCSTSKLIFDKLIAHCGLEAPLGSSTMIVNSNTNALAANVSSSLHSKVHAAAQQAITTINQSKGLLKGISALLGFLGLWLLKARLLRPRPLKSEERYRSRISRPRGKGNLAERLIDDRSLIERSAIHRLSVCENELASSIHNGRLLKDDWARIGSLRIGGGAPTGFRDVDLSRCSISQYLWDLGHDARDDATAVPRYTRKESRKETKGEGSRT